MRPVYLNYYNRTLEGEAFFAFDGKCYGFWTRLREILRERGSDLVCQYFRKAPRDAGAVIFHHVGRIKDIKRCFRFYPKKRRFLYVLEPPAIDPLSHAPESHVPFGHVFSWNKEFQGKKYIPFSVPYRYKPKRVPLSFEEKTLLTMVASNHSCPNNGELYSRRRQMIEYFETKEMEDFEFYGRGWDDSYRNYRGQVPDKYAAISRYRFSITYENSRCTGYVTEKILDCFTAGTVPVYLGAPNITDYVPAGCFIDAEAFKNEEELFDYLKGIGPEEYQCLLDNAAAFLESDAAKQFDHEEIAQLVADKLLAVL